MTPQVFDERLTRNSTTRFRRHEKPRLFHPCSGLFSSASSSLASTGASRRIGDERHASRRCTYLALQRACRAGCVEAADRDWRRSSDVRVCLRTQSACRSVRCHDCKARIKPSSPARHVSCPLENSRMAGRASSRMTQHQAGYHQTGSPRCRPLPRFRPRTGSGGGTRAKRCTASRMIACSSHEAKRRRPCM